MPSATHATVNSPSPWVVDHAHLIPAGGQVLDLACGNGRHTRCLQTLGYKVVAADKDLSGVNDLATTDGIELLQADLELANWPFSAGQFNGIVVTNYLHRPHFPHILESLAENGLLIFETFARGNEKFGRPRNPAYLLETNELLIAFGESLKVIDFAQTEDRLPHPAVRQSICARRC